MRALVLRITDRVAKFSAQLWILDRYGLVDCGMTGVISRIVRESAERKGVLVDILAFAQHFADEISAAYVVNKIAEILTAEWIVAKILNHCAAIRIGMRFLDLRFCESRVTLEQQRADFIDPEQIDNFFMSQDRISAQHFTAG